MSGWGEKLWDCEKEIFSRAEDGTDFVKQLQTFVELRAAAEKSHAKELRSIVKKMQAHAKENDAGDNATTLKKAWRVVLHETDDMATQHESVIGELTTSCIEPLKTLATDTKARRKELQSELQRLQKALDKVRSQYDKKKSEFDKASKTLESKEQALSSLQIDENATGARVAKADGDVKKAIGIRDNAYGDLQVAAEAYNDARRVYYTETQADVFRRMEENDLERVASMKQMLAAYGQCYKAINPLLEHCHTNLQEAVETVDPGADNALFADVAVTGNQIPADIDVMDPRTVPTSSDRTPQQVNARRVTKKKLWKTTTRKKDAVREDFGHLPPEQRRKALHKRVAELEADRTKYERSLAGMEKTVELYTLQPELGTKKALKEAEKEAADARSNLTRVQEALYKFKLYISALEKPGGQQHHQPTADENLEYDSFASGSEEEEENVHGGGQHTPPPPHMAALSSTPPSRPPPPSAEPVQAPNTQQVRVLYDFSGQAEGELNVREGDMVELVEDDGSGWVRCRIDGVEGYVPQSYVQL